MLGIVRELFVVKKKLFACSEDELGAAINAFQYFVGELHDRLPQEREIFQKSAMNQPTCRSRFPVLVLACTTRARAANLPRQKTLPVRRKILKRDHDPSVLA